MGKYLQKVEAEGDPAPEAKTKAGKQAPMPRIYKYALLSIFVGVLAAAAAIMFRTQSAVPQISSDAL